MHKRFTASYRKHARITRFQHQRAINMRACATPTTTVQSQLFYNKHGMLTNVHVIIFFCIFSVFSDTSRGLSEQLPCPLNYAPIIQCCRASNTFKRTFIHTKSTMLQESHTKDEQIIKHSSWGYYAKLTFVSKTNQCLSSTHHTSIVNYPVISGVKTKTKTM